MFFIRKERAKRCQVRGMNLALFFPHLVFLLEHTYHLVVPDLAWPPDRDAEEKVMPGQGAISLGS